MDDSKKSKAHSKAVNNYAAKNYDRVHILLRKGEKERWTTEALNRGFVNDKGQLSLSAFIRDCVEKQINNPDSDCKPSD